MGPIHAIADKVARFRKKGSIILGEFQKYLIKYDTAKYGYLAGYDFTKIMDRARFLANIAKTGLFLPKNQDHSRFDSFPELKELFLRAYPFKRVGISKL